MPRDDQYFSDMVEWDNAATYQRTVQLLTMQGCQVVGIDATDFSLEYPLMALLRESRPKTLFVHVGVHNASLKFRPPEAASPCAIVHLTPTAQNISVPK